MGDAPSTLRLILPEANLKAPNVDEFIADINASMSKYLEEGKDQQGKGFDPRKLLAPGAKAIEAKCKEKIELFGCAGKG